MGAAPGALGRPWSGFSSMKVQPEGASLSSCSKPEPPASSASFATLISSVADATTFLCHAFNVCINRPPHSNMLALRRAVLACLHASHRVGCKLPPSAHCHFPLSIGSPNRVHASTACCGAPYKRCSFSQPLRVPRPTSRLRRSSSAPPQPP